SPAGIIANLTNKNYLISGNAIAGAATLVKNGPGLLLLSGTNTYTGGTTISGGTVLVNGNSAASTSLVTVSGNAIFGGTGSHGGTVLVNAGGRLAPGGMGVVGALTLTNNLALNGGNVFYELANSTGGTNDFVAVGNTVYLTNANVILLSGAAPAGDYLLMSYAATNGPGTFALASSYPNTSLIINPTNLVLRVGAGGAVFGLTWKGNVSGTWDASALNWTNGIMATNFSLGDNVVFDDTLANNPVVTNATPGAVVLPGAVTFNNSLTN
ncbi:MAG: autotransporter-associated beta strand repeat-containing protein, partial [Verrucomicrobiota bacterium]